MDKRTYSQQTTVKPPSLGRPDMFDPTTVSIVVAILVVLLSIVAYWLSKKSSRKSILLVGLADSGKTALFTQLISNSFANSLTSMKENVDTLPVKGGRKLVSLVDLPGYDRLRNQYWEKFKFQALAVVYVVDSVSFIASVHNVADLLYQFLSDDFVISKRIPFLVACTKQDETRAKTAKSISAQLEKEFNTIRETRLGALDTTAGDDNTRRVLGKPDREFSFADLKNSIEFVDCSSSNEASRYESILKWFDTVV